MTPFNGSVADLARLGTPALIPLAGTGKTPGGFAALTGSHDGKLTVSPKIRGRSTFGSVELDAIRKGRSYAVWRNSAHIPVNAALGKNGTGIIKLQVMLQVAGYSSVAVTGSYDPATARAVSEFQGSRGLRRTGTLDPVTLIHFYQALSGPAQPGLKGLHKAGDQ